MNVMKGTRIRIGPDSIEVEVKEIWAEVINGQVIPWVSTVTVDEMAFPYTLRLTRENISERSIIFLPEF